MQQDYYRLLGELQTIDFFLAEINLHLNRHPHDSSALERQQQYHHLREELNKEYKGCIRLLHSAQQKLATKK